MAEWSPQVQGVKSTKPGNPYRSKNEDFVAPEIPNFNDKKDAEYLHNHPM